MIVFHHDSEHGGGLKPELSELSIYEPVRAEDQVCDLPSF